MTSVTVLCAVLLFALTSGMVGPAVAAPKAPPAETTGTTATPGVDVEYLDGLTRTVAVLPGAIVEFTPARGGAGARVLFVLVRPVAPQEPATTAQPNDGESSSQPKPLPPCPQPTPLALYRLELADPPRLEPLIEDLPHDVATLAVADLDGDGRDEPLLRRPGELVTVRNGALEVLLRDERLVGTVRRRSGTDRRERDAPPFALAAPLGGLELFAPDAAGRWGKRATVELPRKAVFREGLGLRVTSGASLVGRDEQGRLLFATAPEAFGQQRLRVTGATLSTAGESATVEAWLQLPEPEQVLEQHFLELDGRIALLVTTKPAGTLDLFGEKRLRLYAIEPDRSRLGRAPVWQAESRMNLWQEAHPRLIDATGDGRGDLVIGYWKGLSDDRVVFDVYPRRDDGLFDTAAVTTAFDVKDADRSVVLYGADPTGDGRADLVLSARGLLAIHPGMPPAGGRNLVDRRPLPLPEIDARTSGVTTVSVSSGGGIETWTEASGPATTFADLDGDGDDEILQRVSRSQGLDELRILDLDGSPDPGRGAGSGRKR